jgi:ribosome-binding factor A
MSYRLEKINSLLQQHVSEIISRELSIKKGVFLTVAKVDTSADLRYAQVFVSVFPVSEEAYIKKTLEKELFRIQRALNNKMATKIIPRLEFFIDKRQQNISELDRIFKQIDDEKMAKSE